MRILCALLLFVWLPSHGYAQTIELVVGFAPGGTSSTVAHHLKDKLQGELGQTVIVVNMPGAGGLVAAEYVKRQRPGTALLLLSSTTLTWVPPGSGLKPVSQVAEFGYVLAVSPSTDISSVQDYMKRAKGDDALRAYASPGPLTLPHLVMDELGHAERVQLTAVPFRGSAPAALAVLGGHAPATMLPMPDYLPHSYGLRALATTGAKRSKALPDLPTLIEAGYAIEANGWLGIVTPEQTSQSDILRMNRAIALAVGAIPEEVIRGFTRKTGTPEEFGELHRRDFTRWLPVAERLKPSTPDRP